MELIVKEVTFPEIIEFNYEELKKEISEKADLYKNLVYTENQVKDAKSDKASLNKFIKVLTTEKVKVKNECLKPYTDFEQKIKELNGIVREAVESIDNQLSVYEDKRKEEKLKKIEEYFESIENKPFEFELNAIFNERWLNTTFSIKKVKEEIEDKIKQIHADMYTLETLPEYSFEAIEVYKSTLDLNKAISEGQRLADIQKRKQEAERREQEEKQKQKTESQRQEDVKVINDPVSSTVEETTDTEEHRQWTGFEAYLSVADATALKQFFEDRDIKFRPIKEK